MLKAIAGKIMSSVKSNGGTGVAGFVKNIKFNILFNEFVKNFESKIKN